MCPQDLQVHVSAPTSAQSALTRADLLVFITIISFLKRSCPHIGQGTRFPFTVFVELFSTLVRVAGSFSVFSQSGQRSQERSLVKNARRCPQQSHFAMVNLLFLLGVNFDSSWDEVSPRSDWKARLRKLAPFGEKVQGSNTGIQRLALKLNREGFRCCNVRDGLA